MDAWFLHIYTGKSWGWMIWGRPILRKPPYLWLMETKSTLVIWFSFEYVRLARFSLFLISGHLGMMSASERNSVWYLLMVAMGMCTAVRKGSRLVKARRDLHFLWSVTVVTAQRTGWTMKLKIMNHCMILSGILGSTRVGLKQTRMHDKHVGVWYCQSAKWFLSESSANWKYSFLFL